MTTRRRVRDLHGYSVGAVVRDGTLAPGIRSAAVAIIHLE